MQCLKPVLAAVAALLALTLVLPAAAAAPASGDGSQQVLVLVADGRDAPAVAAAARAEPLVGDAVPAAPVVPLEVTDAGLAALRRDQRVQGVLTRGTTVETTLAQSVPKVGTTTLHADGYDGDGQVVAVIDTGVATTFGGSLVGQACFAASVVGGGGLDPHCGTGSTVERAFSQDCFDAGVCQLGDELDAAAARPCDDGEPADCLHGTAVAAVAARHTVPVGVAPDAGVYAIRVFNDTGQRADLFDVYLALEHLVRMVDAGAFDLAAVNLSLATTPPNVFVGDCLDEAGTLGDQFEYIFGQLRARGVAAVVAAGNDGIANRMGFPACLPGPVAVGATDLDDDVASFSNRGSALDLMAPGADEASPGTAINGLDIPGSSVASWAGTSFSAPHVAGAYALVEPRYPKASVTQLTALLRSTGRRVRDPATGSLYARLDLANLGAGFAAELLYQGTAGVTGSPRAALGDLNDDGRTDVIVHGPGSGADAISYGRTTWGFDRRTVSLPGDQWPVVGQLRGAVDGPEDVLWYAPGTAADLLWTGRTTHPPQASAVTVSGTYAPVVGDFDGDGWDDVLWYAPGSALDPVWYGGASTFTKGVLDIRGTYSVRAADFDGDSRDDLLLYSTGSTHHVWFGESDRTVTKTILTAPGSRRLAIGDVNGDTAGDLLLHGPGSASDHLLLGAGTRSFTSVATTVGGTYEPVLADVDRDGLDDIYWYAPGPAPDPIWSEVADGTPGRRYTTSVTGTYRPMIGDLDGDAHDDIVWGNAAAALTPVWWSYVPPGG